MNVITSYSIHYTKLYDTVVMLGSAQASAMKAGAALEAAAADSAAAAAAVAAAQANELEAASELARVASTQAALVAERELEVVRLQAQISDQGRIASLTRLGEIRLSEAALSKAQAAAEAELTAARAATTAAITTQTGATTALSAAHVQATATAKEAALAQTLLGRAFLAVKGYAVGLWAVSYNFV